MFHLIKKLKKDSIPSPSRLWYNEWVENNAKGSVLDIGKSRFWDYSGCSYLYKTLDINESSKPDIVEDIYENSVCGESFETVLCNGMYECVRNPQKMVDEVYRILEKGGMAIFGFVGEEYKPYKKDWQFYKDNIDFKEFKIIERKDFDKRYHFIICQKV